MTRRIRVRGKYRRPLNDDQLALAFLMHARALREEAAKGEKKTEPKRRAT